MQEGGGVVADHPVLSEAAVDLDQSSQSRPANMEQPSQSKPANLEQTNQSRPACLEVGGVEEEEGEWGDRGLEWDVRDWEVAPKPWKPLHLRYLTPWVPYPLDIQHSRYPHPWRTGPRLDAAGDSCWSLLLFCTVHNYLSINFPIYR